MKHRNDECVVYIWMFLNVVMDLQLEICGYSYQRNYSLILANCPEAVLSTVLIYCADWNYLLMHLHPISLIDYIPYLFQ